MHVIESVAEQVKVDAQLFLDGQTCTLTLERRDDSRVYPLAVLLKHIRSGLGQANEFLLSLDPAFGASSSEELGFVADRVLVEVEALFFSTNEDGDDVLEVFNGAVGSYHVSLDHSLVT